MSSISNWQPGLTNAEIIIITVSHSSTTPRIMYSHSGDSVENDIMMASPALFLGIDLFLLTSKLPSGYFTVILSHT